MELYEKEWVTVSEMKELERLADEAGLSYYDMMENAGTCAYSIIRECGSLPGMDQDQCEKGFVRVYVGKGNNGGDGFVVARKLSQEGWKVEVVLVEGLPETRDAITNRWLAEDAGVTIRPLQLDDESEEPKDVRIPWMAVDAIYGTGYHGELRPQGKFAVEEINRFRSKGTLVFSLDIPSGLPGEPPEEMDLLQTEGVHADMTIVFHREKPVHRDPRFSSYMGRVISVDIGIPGVLGKENEESEDEKTEL